MLIRKIKPVNLDPENVSDAMKNIEKHKIEYLNWENQFPQKPKVEFKIAHDGNNLILHYFVEENEILAHTAENNGPVWTDSCVEFFISLCDSPYYYNFEFSCIGKILLGYRKTKQDSEHAPLALLKNIKHYASLGNEPFNVRKGDFKWDLLLIIPIATFWKSSLKKFDGIKAKANFYKCGDNLPTPHYLSWHPITSVRPNFHLPEFFAPISFE